MVDRQRDRIWTRLKSLIWLLVRPPHLTVIGVGVLLGMSAKVSRFPICPMKREDERERYFRSYVGLCRVIRVWTNVMSIKSEV